jgi:predicted PurR-regulated permease PerM
MKNADFIRKLLIAIGVLAFAVLLWRLKEVWLLLFGAIVVATILQSMTDPIALHTRLPRKWALAVSILIISCIAAFAAWFAGSEISSEFSNLSVELPKAWASFQKSLRAHAAGDYLMRTIDGLEADGGVIFRISAVALSVVNSLTDLLLILVGGLYFAADPRLYYDGALRLVPKTARPRVEEALDGTGIFLRKWLRAKLIEMASVGIMTTAGLLLIGFPSALALGLVAGLAEFVPYIGLVAAVLPAILIALTLGPDTLLWVIVVYTVVQQIEGNIIMPLVEQKMVYVPPVLTIFSLVVFALLFGPLGLLFAAPLTVVLMVLVKKLYMQGALGDS